MVMWRFSYLYERRREVSAARAREIWQDLQRDLANLSSNSVYSVVESSGHFIQRDQPEVVVDAICRGLDSVPRRRSRVRPP